MEWLDVYVDGELANGPHAALERHLAGCADCRTYLDAYQKTIELVRRVGLEDELGQELPRELMRSILASGRRGSTWRAWA